MTSGNRISLVLGSGGARGLAHIGIIERLEERGFEIRSVAGASMGALVGGIFAAGRLDEYREWVCSLDRRDVLKLLDLSFSRSGLFQGERIMSALKKLVGEHEIESLPVEYTAVATDLERQREVWFRDGSLFDAIRASIAVPMVLTPHRYAGMTLVDGGLLNPVPITPTLSDRTDMTIAVSLNAAGRRSRSEDSTSLTRGTGGENDDDSSYRERVQAFFEKMVAGVAKPSGGGLGFAELVTSSFETMQDAIASIKLAMSPPDLLVEIPRDSASFFEFYRAQELIDLGKRKLDEAFSRKSRAD